MRHSYFTTDERKEKDKSEELMKVSMEKENRDLKKKLKTSTDMLEEFKGLAKTPEQVDLVHEIARVLNEHNGSVQVDMINNLMGKLKSGRNHHFHEQLKEVSKMFKNWLGDGHYAVLQVCNYFKVENRFDDICHYKLMIMDINRHSR